MHILLSTSHSLIRFSAPPTNNHKYTGGTAHKRKKYEREISNIRDREREKGRLKDEGERERLMAERLKVSEPNIVKRRERKVKERERERKEELEKGLYDRETLKK